MLVLPPIRPVLLLLELPPLPSPFLLFDRHALVSKLPFFHSFPVRAVLELLPGFLTQQSCFAVLQAIVPFFIFKLLLFLMLHLTPLILRHYLPEAEQFLLEMLLFLTMQLHSFLVIWQPTDRLVIVFAVRGLLLILEGRLLHH